MVKNVRESTLSLKAGTSQQFIDFQRNVFYQDKDNTKLRSEQSQMMSIRRWANQSSRWVFAIDHRYEDAWKIC